MSDEESTGTVLTALFANLVIAVAKIVAGLLSGSSAMLAEGAHSVADTTNQVFLLIALRLSRRPPDETHPFGYGKERFFWSLLAAVGIFVSGAVFSVYEGVHSLLAHTESETRYLLSYLVLGVAFVAEGVSWLRAVRQLRAEAARRDRDIVEHLRLSSDPTVKTVFSEDSAALVGLLLAAAGLALHQITGQAFWDAAAAIAIGVLLAVVAYLLGRDTKELLIGEAAPAPVRRALRDALAGYDEIDRVLDVRTMLVGPMALLVAARVDMDDRLDAAGVEDATVRIDTDLRSRFPEIRETYLEARSSRSQVAASTPEASSESTSAPSATR
ncbi:MAG TPA: cation diffusion facilitator family transporter [Mycobacteriales bacterium]|nr:cation diffusion facilitator family transporter [Mycobacteriales bacterium]